MTERVVVHLDMDAFYASVEQRDRPELQGKPVIIGADPQKGQGRGVVAAASYEAREYGVRSAMPISRAWRACPNGVYLRPRHRTYSQVSRRVFSLIEERVDVLEQTSIDEGYADVTGSCQGSFRRAEDLAQELKDEIQDRFDLTASIGIGPNKLVAKIASDLDKPDGLSVVPPDRVADVLGPLEARVIPGVGPKTYQTLKETGIRTVAELAEADPDAMAERFGTWGPQMVALAQGHDDRPVDPEHDRKSVGAETTFREDLAPDQARHRLKGVVEEAVDRLQAAEDQARTITLKVRTAGFDTSTRSRTLQAPTDEIEPILEVVLELYGAEIPDQDLRLLGVRLSSLDKTDHRQASLSEWPADVLGEADPPEPPGGPLWRF